MADTNTPNYSFVQPEVGASEDTWGTKINGNWSDVDELLGGDTPLTGIDINSGTLDNTPIGADVRNTGEFTTVYADDEAQFGSINITQSDTQALSTQNDLGYVSAPWVYASALEAVTEGGANSTGISLGAGGSTPTTAGSINNIYLYSGGIDVLLVNQGGGIQAQNGRDFVGNLVGNVTGAVTGNASTATALNGTNLASAGIGNVAGKATQSDAETGTDNDQLMSALRTRQAIDSTCLGRDQSWTSVTGSRSGGTSYQNTTGRPISVFIEISTGSEFTVQVSANGSNWIKVGIVDGGTEKVTASFIVPDDHYYRIVGSPTLSQWSELR